MNGRFQQRWVKRGIAAFFSSVLIHSAVQAGEKECSADFNSDNRVDQIDLQILLDEWNQSPASTDLTGDQRTNGYDLAILLNQWGECGASCPEDLNADGEVNGEDVDLLFAQWTNNSSVSGAAADFNRDKLVNAYDLAILLAAWGPCDRGSCTQQSTMRDVKFRSKVGSIELDQLGLGSKLK
jgi:hypothetical protein